MKPGFTFIEVLLSVGLVSIIAAFSIPVYHEFSVKNDVRVAAFTIAQSLQRAQTLARASSGDSTWGVRVQSGSIVLFKGASYAARNNGFDEQFDLSDAITPSGLQEVVFSKFEGLPSQTGTTTLTSITNETSTIVVNSKGMVAF